MHLKAQLLFFAFALSDEGMVDDTVNATTIQGSTSPGQQRPARKGTPRQATQAGTPRAAGTPRTKSGGDRGSGPTPRRGTGTPRTGTPRKGGAGTPTRGGAASPRAGSTPRTAAAQTPELGGTSGPGTADPSWVTKLAAHEAELELGSTQAEREEAKEVNKLFVSLMTSLEEYKMQKIEEWGRDVESSSQAKLKLPLLRRDDETRLLSVNFDKDLDKLLREVKYFLILGLAVPDSALQIYKKAEVFRQQTGNLALVVKDFNNMGMGETSEDGLFTL